MPKSLTDQVNAFAKLLDDLKQATTEAHGVLKDLRGTLREARDLINTVPACGSAECAAGVPGAEAGAAVSAADGPRGSDLMVWWAEVLKIGIPLGLGFVIGLYCRREPPPPPKR